MPEILFIGKQAGEIRVAFYEYDKITELYIDKNKNGGTMGNVYKGKVQDVIPGMQAAFVDIGQPKNAFLYTGDIKKDPVDASEKLRPGRHVIVQVLKETPDNKGARVTMNLTFAGMYIICIPNGKGAFVSKKIHNRSEKDRLYELACRIRPEDYGIIMRTEAEGIAEDLIENDLKFVMKKIKDMDAKKEKCSAPCLLYNGADTVEFAIRELLKQSTGKLLVDDTDCYKTVGNILDWYSPDMKSKLAYASVDESKYWHDKIDACIVRITGNKVWLKCGGYIVIDRTEALTVIDVNSGKNIGNKNLRDTVLETNIQAADEIAKQLRLRDIGGVIVIDFIDMKNENDKKLLLDELRKALRADSMRTVVAGITGLNLVEMTRKRRRPDLNILERCPKCKGSGFIRSE